MKLAILGSGKIVQEALPMICGLPLEKKVLWGRAHSREKLEGLKKQFHLDAVSYDYEELLSTDVDTVYVALPNDVHYEYTMKAIEAGKNVILEKPAVPTVKELNELRSTAEKNGVILVEAMNVHHLPLYETIREKLPLIGNLKMVSLNFSQYSSRYDRFKRGDIAPAFDPKHYGGALMDLNVYNVHFLCGLFGMPESFSYQANMERNIDTSGILTMRYPGFLVSAIAAKDCEAPTVCTLQGDKGLIVISQAVNKMVDFRLILNDGTAEEYHSDPDVYRLKYEFENFIRMIDTKDTAKAAELMNISEMACAVLEKSALMAGLFKKQEM